MKCRQFPNTDDTLTCAVCVCVCVQVNGVDLRGASHEEAIAALRQTPPKVRLTVLRDEAQYRDEENLDIFKVELQKKSGRGLGLSIVGKRSTLKHTTHAQTQLHKGMNIK